MRVRLPVHRWLFAAACAVLLLAGCSTNASGPLYQAPPRPPAGYATVIIYRVPSPVGASIKFDWFIDDHLAVRINNQGYSRVVVRAGQHYLHNTLPAATSQLKLAPLMVAGRTYYFRNSQLTKDNRPYLRIQLVPAAEAEAELASYHFQPPISENID